MRGNRAQRNNGRISLATICSEFHFSDNFRGHQLPRFTRKTWLGTVRFGPWSVLHKDRFSVFSQTNCQYLSKNIWEHRPSHDGVTFTFQEKFDRSFGCTWTALQICGSLPKSPSAWCHGFLELSLSYSHWFPLRAQFKHAPDAVFI